MTLGLLTGPDYERLIHPSEKVLTVQSRISVVKKIIDILTRSSARINISDEDREILNQSTNNLYVSNHRGIHDAFIILDALRDITDGKRTVYSLMAVSDPEVLYKGGAVPFRRKRDERIKPETTFMPAVTKDKISNFMETLFTQEHRDMLYFPQGKQMQSAQEDIMRSSNISQLHSYAQNMTNTQVVLIKLHYKTQPYTSHQMRQDNVVQKVAGVLGKKNLVGVDIKVVDRDQRNDEGDFSQEVTEFYN